MVGDTLIPFYPNDSILTIKEILAKGKFVSTEQGSDFIIEGDTLVTDTYRFEFRNFNGLKLLLYPRDEINPAVFTWQSNGKAKDFKEVKYFDNVRFEIAGLSIGDTIIKDSLIFMPVDEKKQLFEFLQFQGFYKDVSYEKFLAKLKDKKFVKELHNLMRRNNLLKNSLENFDAFMSSVYIPSKPTKTERIRYLLQYLQQQGYYKELDLEKFTSKLSDEEWAYTLYTGMRANGMLSDGFGSYYDFASDIGIKNIIESDLEIDLGLSQVNTTSSKAEAPSTSGTIISDKSILKKAGISFNIIEQATLKSNENIVLNVIGKHYLFEIQRKGILDEDLEGVKKVVTEKLGQRPIYQPKEKIESREFESEFYEWNKNGVGIILHRTIYVGNDLLKKARFNPMNSWTLRYRDRIIQNLLLNEYSNDKEISPVIK
jgi:hypothetical protein